MKNWSKFKRFITNVCFKIRYTGAPISKERALILRKKNEDKRLRRITKDINRDIRESSCKGTEKRIHLICDKSFGDLAYWFIKYERSQIALTEKQFYSLIRYYDNKGYRIRYNARKIDRYGEDLQDLKIKNNILFDAKKLEPVDPEGCNFYIEW